MANENDNVAKSMEVAEYSYSTLDGKISSVGYSVKEKPGLSLHVHKENDVVRCVELVGRGGEHVYLYEEDRDVVVALVAKLPPGKGVDSSGVFASCQALCPCCQERCSGMHHNQVHGVEPDNHWGGAKF